MVAPTWKSLAYACALLVAAAIAYFLLHVPFQLGDNLNPLLQLEGDSAWRIFSSSLVSAGFMRPLTLVTSKVVFETARLSGGHYFLVYRLVHVLLVILLLTMTMKLMEVNSFLTFALAMLAVAAVIGLHPFHEAVHETELNVKLIMVTACMISVVVAAAPRRWWSDVAAITLAAYAMFANELGLLVWVCLVTGYIVGFRGVSVRALAIVTAILGFYFYLRFFTLNVGAPTLTERSSGYGFSMRDPPELIAMFGAHPLPFYAYNVVASALTVLLSEPRGGVFVFVRDLLRDRPTIGMFINVISSALTTIVMVWYAARRCGAWIAGELTHDDRLFVVAAAVIAANAAISFPYAKDVTMSTGAAFYPLAMFAAIRWLLADVANRRMRLWGAVLAYTLVAAVSVGWTIRAFSLYVDMRRAAYKAQSDWVTVDEWLDEQHIDLATASQRQLVEQLRAQMLGMTVPKVYLEPKWLGSAIDPLH